MQERTGIAQFKGSPVTLLGPELKIGDHAPEFKAVDTDLKSVGLADFAGMTKLICTVPSLDTPVCDTEIRRFNQEATQLADNVVVLAISMDLPFAQKRWCASAGIDRVSTLSDYQEHDFALGYGVLIKELKLLSRSIFVVDTDNVIRYVQHVSEITDGPDYAAALDACRGEIVSKEIPADEICGGY